MGEFFKMDNTQNSISGSSLKSKLMALEEMIRGLSEELNLHKKEVESLKKDKENMENVLTNKAAEIKKNLSTEVLRVEEEMKRHFAHQKAENSRLQQQITNLKGEKTSLKQKVIDLKKRISELEIPVGREDN